MNQLPPFPESTFFQVSDDVNSIIYHELLCCIWNIGKERRSIYAHYYNVYTKELLNQISLYFYFFWISNTSLFEIFTERMNILEGIIPLGHIKDLLVTQNMWFWILYSLNTQPSKKKDFWYHAFSHARNVHWIIDLSINLIAHVMETV